MELGPIFRTMTKNKIGVGLLVMEIAFTLAIILNCVNIIRREQYQMTRPNGLDEKNIIAVTLRPYGKAFEETEFLNQTIRQDLDRLRSLPGVVSASAISPFPLIGGGSSTQIKPLGAEDTRLVRSPVYSADPQFLETLGLELIAGRAFTPEDLPEGTGPQPLNVLITKDLADALFPDGDALGKQIDTGSPDFPDTVVGIIRHMQTPYDNGGPMETRITFFPGFPGGSTRLGYLVRAEPAGFDTLMADLPDQMLSLNRERVVEVQTLLEFKSNAFMLNSMVTRILSWVIVLLLFVTGVGIFGMTAYAVASRTKQIGVRRALGARKQDIVRYFLVENTLIAAFGISLGLVGAYLINIQMVTHTSGTPLNAGLTLGGALFVWLVGLTAALLPALKGASVPPAVASRTV